MKNERAAARSSYNQLLQLLLDPTFREIAKIEKERLNKTAKVIKDRKYFSFKFVRESKKVLSRFLYEKRLPQVWLEPLLFYIKDEDIPLPIDNGIDLKIGSQKLSETKKEILIIRDKGGMLPPGEASISIVISSRTSADRIIKFVKENAVLIKHWQSVLDLPPYSEMSWKKTELAFEIIRMKDQEELSYSQISGKLSEKEDLSENELNYLSNAENIKSLYRRYKKYFFNK